MRILSSPKPLRQVPWTLIIIFINLVLLGGPVEALKCYRCTCWTDCVINKNLFKEEECPSNYNACRTKIPTKEGVDDIAKRCFITYDGETEDRRPEMIYKYCYTDLCNDQEAGGITNPNPRSSNGGGGVLASGKITGWIYLPAMILAYVCRWLIN